MAFSESALHTRDTPTELSIDSGINLIDGIHSLLFSATFATVDWCIVRSLWSLFYSKKVHHAPRAHQCNLSQNLKGPDDFTEQLANCVTTKLTCLEIHHSGKLIGGALALLDCQAVPRLCTCVRVERDTKPQTPDTKHRTPQIIMYQLYHAFTSLLQVFQPIRLGVSNSPLITAVLAKQTETVRHLLVGGADTSAMDDLDHNALHYAAMGGYEEILLLLLCNGANINARNGTGSNLTALAIAVASDEEVVGKILIGRGATIAPDSLSAFGMETHDRWIAEYRFLSFPRCHYF